MDWTPGDLALTVRAGPIKCPNPHYTFHRGDVAPPKGSVHEVRVVGVRPMDNGTYCGCINLQFTDGSCGIVQRFIKVTPGTEDSFDQETIALYTRQPSLTEASARAIALDGC